MAFTVRSGVGTVSCLNRIGSENEPITIRITTGISVQAISIRVLWVKLAGVGLRRLLKRTTTMASSATTKSTITTMIPCTMCDRKCMSSATGVTAGW